MYTPVSIRCSCCSCHLRFADKKDIGNLAGKTFLCEDCLEMIQKETAYVKVVSSRAARQIYRIADQFSDYCAYLAENGVILPRGDVVKDKKAKGLKILDTGGVKRVNT